MEPAFRRGDWVYVDPNAPVRTGDFVAVRRDGTTIVRRLQVEAGRLVLVKLNPDEVEYAIDARNETMIRGVVVFTGGVV